MPQIKVKGLIIKQSVFGEANRMISIFTHEQGIIRAAVYGAKSIKSKKNASTQFLTYAEFILTKSGTDIYTVQSTDVSEHFFPIQEDIEKLSLCAYLTDLTYTLINQDSSDNNILNLLLNTLYALAYKDIPILTVKAVFELKVTSMAGYMPNMNCCYSCNDTKSIKGFSVNHGGLVCQNCFSKEDISITADVYHAIIYILSSESKKVFSFSASDEVLKVLYEISEKYALFYIDKEPASLDYFKRILI